MWAAPFLHFLALKNMKYSNLTTESTEEVKQQPNELMKTGFESLFRFGINLQNSPLSFLRPQFMPKNDIFSSSSCYLSIISV